MRLRICVCHRKCRLFLFRHVSDADTRCFLRGASSHHGILVELGGDVPLVGHKADVTVALLKVRCWHNSDMPPWSLYVRCWGQSGKHILALSFSAFDPGCVKTCTRGECAELFSLFSS